MITIDGGTGIILNNGVEVASPKQFDEWRMSADQDLSNTETLTNWERTDSNFDLQGTGMTHSSGVFTFPSTGIYEVVSKVAGSRSGGSNKYCNWRTFMSVDSGNTYNIRDQGSSCMTDFSGTNTINIYSPTILNITNASTTRLRFGTYGGNNNFTVAAGGFGTTVTFRKLSVATM